MCKFFVKKYFGYNYNNQMNSAWDPMGFEAYYNFSEDGERLSKRTKYWDGYQIGEEVENYLYDFDDDVRDYDTNWNLKKIYFRGSSIDEVLVDYDYETQQWRYYYSDALGSTRQLCDENGNILQRFDYDAWGTMKEINPELYTEKGTVQGAVDMSVDEDTFEITLDSVNNTAVLNINVMNIGEENSILEYSVFYDTRPAGVYINEGYGNITVNGSSNVKINIYGDYFTEGDHQFNCIVNSNNGSMSYNIIIHKDYGTVYQEWYDGEDETKPVLQKPQILTRYTYTGREYNRETGHYYYRARTYISSIGRFTGKDNCPNCYPFYKYVNNNPLKYSDSSGRKIDQIFANIVDKYLDVVVADKGGTMEAFWEEMVKGPGRYGNESFEECLDRHLPDVNILDEKINLDGYQQFATYQVGTVFALFESVSGLAAGYEAGENIIFTISFWSSGTGWSLLTYSGVSFATGYSIGTLLDCGLIKENK